MISVNFVKPLFWNFSEPQKLPKSEKVTCPIQVELDNFKTKCTDNNIAEKYKELQKVLDEKDKALDSVKSTMMELKNNIQDRDRMAANQEETICVLQSSLTICQKEVEESQQMITSLETKNNELEKEYRKKEHQFNNQLAEMKNSLKNSEDITQRLKGGVSVFCKTMFAEVKSQYLQTLEEVYQEKKAMEIVQNANLELATLAGSLRTDCWRAQNRLSELYKERTETQKKHEKSEAALQIIIQNLKEKICENEKQLGKLQMENQMLQTSLEQIKNDHKMEIESLSNKESDTILENENVIAQLKNQVKTLCTQLTEMESKLNIAEDEICESKGREKQLQHQMSVKETLYKDEICEKQKEFTKLSNVIKTMTEKLKDATNDLETERKKCYEMEQKLRTVCAACEEYKMKLKESECKVEKLQAAFTQLSNKFVSSHLDKGNVRHYQDQCAMFESLYNTASCKLLSKEAEMDSMMKEIERLRGELNCISVTSIHQRDSEEDCPFLLGRVQQLSKELQLAQSCRANYESQLKDLTEKYCKKDDEVSALKIQIKQITMQRDSLLMDLEVAQEQIAKLKVEISEMDRALRRLETSKAQIADQMKNVQRMICDSHSQSGNAVTKIQPNIELQREFSTALSNQLRTTKQKLHTVRHDYKLLQTAYEELSGKYSLLQRGERDTEPTWDTRPTHQTCVPCAAKSAKSLAHLKHSQEHLKNKNSSHSKSWHKLETGREVEEQEKIWKQKLQQVIRGEVYEDSSSS